MPGDAEEVPETAAPDGAPPNAAAPGRAGVPAPPPGLVTVGYFDERPGYAVDRPRGADSWLVTWTTAGRGRLEQGGVTTVATAGELVVLGPGVPHRYGVAADARRWAFWWVHCQARPPWGGWLRPFRVGGAVHVVGPVPRATRTPVAAAFARAHAAARWAGDAHPPAPPGVPEPGQVAVAHGWRARELALGGVEEALLLATAGGAAVAVTADGAAARSGSDAEAGVDPRVRRVVARIAADPGARHTVASLAAEVSLSPSRLAHLFTEQLGHSPMRALRDARLRHAALLLEATALPVARVAAVAGFASPHHFSRLFRARYGVPPGAYRDGPRGAGPSPPSAPSRE
ncbi:helix-turn-helix domain-containing protein [Streptomyces sp. 4N509B]|uniref:helix-turn-helix domain-containing protein n=1 Tax=Streptomyces sp. 4N509B TaxID=3457413 RepID=UPI003FD33C10